jgi:hypothetical protein
VDIHVVFEFSGAEGSGARILEAFLVLIGVDLETAWEFRTSYARSLSLCRYGNARDIGTSC